MVRMTVLASGSRGNSTVLSSSGTSILVDAGLSCRETLKRMRCAGEDPEQLKAIIISHEHQDHVNGLAVLARKLNVPVFMTKATHREWARWVSPPKRKFATAADYFASRSATPCFEPECSEPACFEPKSACSEPMTFEPMTFEPTTFEPTTSEPTTSEEADRDPALKPDLTEAGVTLPCKSDEGAELEVVVKNPAELPALELFCSGQRFHIGDVEVTPFTIPHDAADPVGFMFKIEGVKVAIATDLGYMPESVKVHLRECDALMIESNHDLEMLREGPYPWSVKQRVLSRVGHLSNRALADFLADDYDGGAAFVVLAHISEANNHPELARECAERALGGPLSLPANRLLVARQSEALESIRL